MSELTREPVEQEVVRLRARVRELEEQLKESHETIQSAAGVCADLTARCARLETALRSLANEASGIVNFPGVVESIGITNQRCLQRRIDESRALHPAQEGT